MTEVFANKLKELRERSQLSYQEVGDRIGLTKQSIFKFEKGLKNPSTDTVIKLCELFNVPYEYFFRMSSSDEIAFEDIWFREDHKLQNKEMSEREIKKTVVEFLTKYCLLENIVDDSQTFSNPLEGISISNEKDIEKAAKTLRKKWKLGNAPILDVVELLENKGIVVIEVRRIEEFTGLSGKFNHTIPIIVLNESFLIERKRFTALHELAHLILGFSKSLTKERIEKFCDIFAGAVLLVDEVLYEELGRNRKTISLAELKKIKESYGISILAIIVRANACDFITYPVYQDWYKIYQEWQKDESDEDLGRFKSLEKPSRFYKLLLRGVYEQKISMSRAAELANKEVDLFKKELDLLKFSLN